MATETVQVVFNVDQGIKAKAMRRARREGVPFASVLKMATKAFANGALSIGLSEEIRPEKMRYYERQSRLFDEGKGTRFKNMKEFRAWMSAL